MSVESLNGEFLSSKFSLTPFASNLSLFYLCGCGSRSTTLDEACKNLREKIQNATSTSGAGARAQSCVAEPEPVGAGTFLVGAGAGVKM